MHLKNNTTQKTQQHPQQKMRGFFITGTDTGTGKTVVCAALGLLLQSKGYEVIPLKPIETGCAASRTNDHEYLVPADGAFLRHHLAPSLSLEDITPLRFASPLSPLAASEEEGKAVDLELLRTTIQNTMNREDPLYQAPRGRIALIEGLGGLMAPITEHYLVHHLIEELGLPAILVAGAGLGTINHTLLSLEFALQRKIEVAGIIINNHCPLDHHTRAKKADRFTGLAERTNPGLIARLSRTPVLGVMPYIKNITGATLTGASKNLNYDIIESYLQH